MPLENSEELLRKKEIDPGEEAYRNAYNLFFKQMKESRYITKSGNLGGKKIWAMFRQYLGDLGNPMIFAYLSNSSDAQKDNPIFEEDTVLDRGIVYPQRRNPFSILNESFSDAEIRKLKRVPGLPTSKKELGTVSGNPRRAASLHFKDQFSHVGYCVVNPKIDDIIKWELPSDDKAISLSGEGNIKMLPEEQSPLDKNVKIKEFEQFKEIIKSKDIFNQVSLNVRNDDSLKFIYFSNDAYPYSISRECIMELETRKLIAIYLSDRFKKDLGRQNITILEYDAISNTPSVFNYDDKKSKIC